MRVNLFSSCLAALWPWTGRWGPPAPPSTARQARSALLVCSAPVPQLLLQLREGLVGDLRDPPEHLPVGHQRRGVLDDGVVLVVEAADEASLQQLPRDDALEVPLVLVPLQGRPVGLLGLDLDRPEEAHASDLLDDRVPQIGRA